MKRTLLLALVLATAAQAALSCAKPKNETVDVYLPFERGSLTLQVLYPEGSGEGATCASPGSWLMSIDTSGTPNGWDLRFLLGPGHDQLFGCDGAAGPCDMSTTTIRKELGETSRIMIEGLAVSPDVYVGAQNGVDVLCRGIADRIVRAEDFSVTPGETPAGSPTPAPSPSPYPGPQLTVVVRMLKVGGSNPMPFDPGGAKPRYDLRHHAAASLSDTENGIGLSATPLDPRGEVAIAGGRVGGVVSIRQDAIWEFVPHTMSFVHSTTVNPAARLPLRKSGLSATATVDSGDNPCVLFAGGDVAGSSQQPTSTLYCRNGTARTATPVPTMAVGHAFHAATRVSVGPRSQILLVGGLEMQNDGTIQTTTSFQAQASVFAPALSNSTPCVATTNPAMCSVANDLPDGRGLLSAARLGSMGAITFGGIFSNVNLETSDKGSPYDLVTNTFNPIEFGTELNPGQAAGATARLTDPLAGTGSGGPLFIGGYLDMLAVPTASVTGAAWTVVNDGDFGPAGSTSIPRVFPAAANLRDHTVLVFGGRQPVVYPDGVLAVERFVPSVVAAPGAFEPGGADLLRPRWGHTATRLEQTQTWLDGAVLLVGGVETSNVDPDLEIAAELYVPAYRCNGDDGVTPAGPVTRSPLLPLSNLSLPEFCDRDRRGEPITNPNTGLPTE